MKTQIRSLRKTGWCTLCILGLYTMTLCILACADLSLLVLHTTYACSGAGLGTATNVSSGKHPHHMRVLWNQKQEAGIWVVALAISCPRDPSSTASSCHTLSDSPFRSWLCNSPARRDSPASAKTLRVFSPLPAVHPRS